MSNAFFFNGGYQWPGKVLVVVFPPLQKPDTHIGRKWVFTGEELEKNIGVRVLLHDYHGRVSQTYSSQYLVDDPTTVLETKEGKH